MQRFVATGSLIALAAVLVFVIREAPTYMRLDRVQAIYDVFDESPEEREAILLRLDRMDRTPMDVAFRDLDDLAFTRYIRTEQMGASGGAVARESRTVRYALMNGLRERIVQATDTQGDFEYGHFRKLISATVDDDDLAIEDPLRYLLDGTPDYLTARGQADYRFRFRADTLIGDLAANVIEAAPRPELQRKTGVKHVRLYLRAGTDELIGLYVKQRTWSMMFKEESAFTLSVQRHEGRWLPRTSQLDARIYAPLTEPRHFRVASTYTDFHAAEAPDELLGY